MYNIYLNKWKIPIFQSKGKEILFMDFIMIILSRDYLKIYLTPTWALQVGDKAIID
jgi:hypothetical protein